MLGVSVARGTLHDQDLVPLFLTALGMRDKKAEEGLRDRYSEVIGRLGEAPDPDEILREHIGWLMDDLFDALNAVAPPGYYFGMLEGNGSTFGFFSSER